MLQSPFKGALQGRLRRRRLRGAERSGDLRHRRIVEALRVVGSVGIRESQELSDLGVEAALKRGVIDPKILAGEVGAKLKFIPIDKNGELRIKNRALRALQPFHGLEELIPPRTKLVGITHVSNVLGTINSVKKIIEQRS